ncbi:MAG: CBS domain-containing protein [Pseudomonadota bacterium]
MNVMQILALKGSDEIQMASPTLSVEEAASELSAKRIGALLVSNDGETISGIVSERDIVRVLGQKGAVVLREPISSLMTSTVVTCASTDSALSVLERMTQGRFRHMPVVDDGKMVGFLSIGDVVKARIAEIESDNAAMAEMLHG